MARTIVTRARVSRSPVNRSSSLLTGLAAYYACNEGGGSYAFDSTPNGTIGVLFNTGWTTGKVYLGLSFNGTNSQVSVADATSIHAPTAISLSTWLYPTDVSAYHTLMGKGSMVELRINSIAQVEFLISGGAGYTATGALSANTWTHILATYDGASLYIWQNGVLVNGAAYAGGLVANTSSLLFGAGSGHFAGTLDEMGIWSRVLLISEVPQVVNGGAGLTYPFLPVRSRV